MRIHKLMLWSVIALVVCGVMLPAHQTAPATMAQETELTIWTEENSIAPLEAIVRVFEQDTGIGVTIEVWSQVDITTWFVETDNPAAGPDIFWLSDDSIWMLDHVLAPIDLGDRTYEFVPFATQAFTHNGQLVGVPVVLKTLMLYRNTDLVPDAPATWDELAAQAAAVRESGAAEHGFVVWNEGGYHVVQMMTAFGGYVFAPRDDGTFDTHDIGLNHEESQEFFTTLQMITQQQGLDPDLDWEAAHHSFETGAVAMIISGPWALARFEESGVPFAVSPIPAGTQAARPYIHVSGFGINAHSNNQDAARLFLTDYVAAENGITQLAATTGLVPAHLTALEKLDDPTALGFAQTMSNGQLFPGRIPEIDAVWGPLGDALHAILFEGADVQPTLDFMVEQIRVNLEG
jgi:arabinogalactan oligomer / maltooligosaccharide transport system substrate-binding protein